MEPEEMGQIENQISHVIVSEFLKEFTPIFQHTCNLLQTVPVQPCHDIHNAMEHFARALTASTLEEGKRHINNALGHIILGQTDCYLLCNAHMRMDLSDYVSRIQTTYGEDAFQEMLGKLATVISLHQGAPAASGRVQQINGRNHAATYELIADCEAHGTILAWYNELYRELRQRFPNSHI
jgi:hypothetical protein